ncbi:AAA family ATPase [Namhaeicola litoreus]|uniref:AAA family ATPase n=1 Tax=Namhaeicola litoreus TaxID=1052145 RepID=A0ABW3Y3C9_9FLAO
MFQDYKLISIGVKNFKIFKNKVEFPIGPLTIFTGTNGSGKSTYTDLLYFLSKAFDFNVIDIISELRIKSWEKISFRNLNEFQKSDALKILNRDSQSNKLSLFFKYLDEDLKSVIEIELGYEIDQKGGSLVEYKISSEECVLLHYKKEDLFKNLNSKIILPIKEHPFSKNKFIFDECKSKFVWFNKINLAAERTINKQKKIRELLINSIFSSYKKLTEADKYIEVSDLIKKSELESIYTLQDSSILLQTRVLAEMLKNNVHKRGVNQEFFNNYINFEEQLYFKLFTRLYCEPNKTYPYDIWSEMFPDIEKDYTSCRNLYLQTDSVENPLPELDFESTYVVKSLEFEEIFKHNEQTLNEEEIREIISSIVNPLTDAFLIEYDSATDFDYAFNYSQISKVLNKIISLVGGMRLRFEVLFLSSFSSVPAKFDAKLEIRPHYIYDESGKKDDYIYQFVNNRFDGYPKMKFINRWLHEFEIGEKLEVQTISSGAKELGFSLFIKRGTQSFPLHLESRGTKKIVQTLLFLCQSQYSTTTIIEEPESNLHPALQSKMAELFEDFIFFILNGFRDYKIHKPSSLIIETHSEYLIRKIQYLIASSDSRFNTTNVRVNYLHHPNKIPPGENQVYSLKIREDGFMNNDFGKGFFDEASSLSLSLLNLKNFN